MKRLAEQDAVAALKQVMDPELHIDIYALELIYKIDIQKDNHIIVTMTLTSPLCPYGPEMVAEAKHRLQDAGFRDPVIEITFDPPWEPSDNVKMAVGLL